jgi:outer membrane protein
MKRGFTLRSTMAGMLSTLMFLQAGATVMAQDIDISTAESIKVKESVVGLGLAFVPEYEGSEDYKAVPIINARFNLNNNMYIGFLGNTLRANLVPSQEWNAGPLLRYRPERNNVKNDQVDAMEKVDAAIEAGGFLSYNLPDWTFSISAAQDIAGAHDGFLLDMGVGYRYKLQADTMLTLNAQTTYASSDYMHTYFSVDQADSLRSRLKTYNADAGLKDFGVGIALQHAYSRKWSVVGVIRYSRLLGDAADSPVVDDAGSANQMLTGAFVNYSF